MQPRCTQQPDYTVPRLPEIYRKPPSWGHLAITDEMLVIKGVHYRGVPLYKQSKTKSVGDMEIRLFMYECLFPTVYSAWSEHHGHCTEGSGSGQCSGLGEWKSNIFSLIAEVCKELYVC